MDVVTGFQQLGFTAYEAKVYVALLERPGSTGYEVARRSGVPRSKVYEVLEGLVARDVVHTSQDGEQVLYHPLPYPVLLHRRRSETTRLIDGLMEALADVAAAEPEGPLITLRGYEAVLKRAAEMVAVAEGNVFISGWPKELARLLPELTAAEARGVQVWALVYGELEAPLARCFYHEPPSPQGRAGSVLPALVVVADHAEAILASVAPTVPVTGLWTRNRGVALIAAEYVKHDIFLNALMQRLGPRAVELMAQMQDFQKMWFA